MNFPLTGIVLLFLGAYFFVFAPRVLYSATVFLIPFSALAVVNVSWGGGGGQKGISAWIFMAALWMLRTAISKRPFWRRAGWAVTRRGRIELAALLACGFISLLVPALLNGTAWIADYQLYSSMTVPLSLTSERVTQTGYFAFGVIFTVFVAVESCSAQRMLQSVRTYVASAIFASGWAFVQLWCILTGHTYPAFLFNNSEGTSAQLYTEVLSQLGLHRVSSVGVEPSLFAFSMLVALSLLLMSLGLRRPILGRKWDFWALLLVSAGLIISTSTTAYMGLVVVSLLVVFALGRAGVLRWRYVILAGSAAAAGVAMVLSIPIIKELVDLVILNKRQGYSAQERIHTMVLAAKYFLQYPVFGVSWNAARSSDLIIEVLASLGVVGFLAFGMFVADELTRLWHASSQGRRWALILLPTVCLTLVVSEVTGFPYALGHAWFILALGIPAPFILNEPARMPLAAASTAIGSDLSSDLLSGGRRFADSPGEL